jgi:hypothetical protein
MKGEIRLLRGRLTFEGGKYPAPFPSAIVIFRPPGPPMVSVSAKEAHHATIGALTHPARDTQIL